MAFGIDIGESQLGVCVESEYGVLTRDTSPIVVDTRRLKLWVALVPWFLETTSMLASVKDQLDASQYNHQMVVLGMGAHHGQYTPDGYSPESFLDWQNIRHTYPSYEPPTESLFYDTRFNRDTKITLSHPHATLTHVGSENTPPTYDEMLQPVLDVVIAAQQRGVGLFSWGELGYLVGPTSYPGYEPDFIVDYYANYYAALTQLRQFVPSLGLTTDLRVYGQGSITESLNYRLAWD